MRSFAELSRGRFVYASTALTCVMSIKPSPKAVFEPAWLPSTTMVWPLITYVVFPVEGSYVPCSSSSA